MKPKIIIIFLLVSQVMSQYEGEKCNKDGVSGICTKLNDCNKAVVDKFYGIKPKTCSFDKNTPIICCLGASETAAPVATTTKRSPSTTTEDYVPPSYDYVVLGNRGTSRDGCAPISPSFTSTRNNHKAWNKCIEYQEKFIYPCEKGVALTGAPGRSFNCYHDADELIVGGKNSSEYEFPHIALLGYGTPPETVEWLCGGSIISERFILTAAHCTNQKRLGPVTFAAIGLLARKETRDPTKRYGIESIIKHKDYTPLQVYNDIALLKTDRDMVLSQFVVPACLDIGQENEKLDRALATGWGYLEHNTAKISEILQKVILTSFTSDECSRQFEELRTMPDGLLDTQICYGDKMESKDTCQGDSGGPLQIKSKKINCMYVIIGVTSTGRGCGFVGQAGIFTKVSNYVPWIESVVWPNA